MSAVDTTEVVLEALGRLQITADHHHQVVTQLHELLKREPGRMSITRLTTARPIHEIAETHDAKSIAVLNFSAITVQLGLAGHSASAGNGIPVPPDSFLVLPLATNMLDVGAAAADLAAGEAQVAIIRFDSQQPLIAGPLGGATVNIAGGVTANSPTSNAMADDSAAVGVASGVLIAANAARKGLAIVNDSANVVYLGLGAAAVLGKGIRLNANGGAWDGLLGAALWTGSVTAIATAAASNVTAVEAT